MGQGGFQWVDVYTLFLVLWVNIDISTINHLVGGLNPSEKYESQLG